MKKSITVRSVLFHFLIVIFAACGVNSTKEANICSHEDSEIFIGENNLAQNNTEDNSHPMLLPNNNILENKSHPMFISPCSTPEE